MVITCEKCNTSFNLDDSLVNESGTKVRCSMCKHIFTAFPKVDAPEPEVAEIEETPDPGVAVEDETFE